MFRLDPDRRNFLGSLINGAVGISIARRGFGQAAPTPIQATQLTDHIVLFSGDGGNVGLIAGEDGLLMIDGGYGDRALGLKKAVADRDAHPVKLLFKRTGTAITSVPTNYWAKPA